MTTSDDSGRYAALGLAPGAYTVMAGGALPWEPATSQVFGLQSRTGVVLEGDAQRSGVDFELRPGGTLAGIVLGPLGEPMAYAMVELRDAAGLVLTPWGSFSDESGAFLLHGLPAGVARVQAKNEGAESPVREVRVVEGGTVRVELVLAP
jgi:hypothetical protein